MLILINTGQIGKSNHYPRSKQSVLYLHLTFSIQWSLIFAIRRKVLWKFQPHLWSLDLATLNFCTSHVNTEATRSLWSRWCLPSNMESNMKLKLSRSRATCISLWILHPRPLLVASSEAIYSLPAQLTMGTHSNQEEDNNHEFMIH